MEKLLDEGIARNVLAIAAVAAAARRRFSGAICFDAAPLVAVTAVIASCAVEVRHVDLDELAVAGGLVAPLVLVVRIAGKILVRRRGLGCGL